MDFWKVVDGKIVDNWVMVDFPHVLPSWVWIALTGKGGKLSMRTDPPNLTGANHDPNLSAEQIN